MITHDAPFIDRRILLQAKSLIEHGYEVTIINPFGDINEDFKNVGINYLRIKQTFNINNSLSSGKRILRKLLPQNSYEKLKLFYFKYADTNFIDYENELLEVASREKFDIYVAHDLPALPIAHNISKENNSKLVYDSHEFFTGQIALKGKRKEFFKKIENELIGDVDLMFTVNDDIANLFKEEYDKKDINVLFNSIEEIDSIEKKDLHNILDIGKEKKIILFQGGFLEDRNLELLVTAAKYLEDNNVLVMLGYSFLEEKLKEIAKKNNIINKKVFFMDRVPQKELLNYTAGADVGIIPYPDVDLNTKFCTPNKMFEYISSMIPIIANKKLVTVSNFLDKYNIGTYVSFEGAELLGKELNIVLKELDFDDIKLKLPIAKKELDWTVQEKVLIEAYKVL